MVSGQEEIELEIEHTLLEKLKVLAAKENITVEQYIQHIMEDYAKKLPLGEAGKNL